MAYFDLLKNQLSAGIEVEFDNLIYCSYILKLMVSLTGCRNRNITISFRSLYLRHPIVMYYADQVIKVYILNPNNCDNSKPFIANFIYDEQTDFDVVLNKIKTIIRANKVIS